jgi:hypothetical protein
MIAAPAPVRTPAAIRNGIAQQTAHATAARMPATLLRIGGALSTGTWWAWLVAGWSVWVTAVLH